MIPSYFEWAVADGTPLVLGNEEAFLVEAGFAGAKPSGWAAGESGCLA